MPILIPNPKQNSDIVNNDNKAINNTQMKFLMFTILFKMFNITVIFLAIR